MIDFFVGIFFPVWEMIVFFILWTKIPYCIYGDHKFKPEYDAKLKDLLFKEELCSFMIELFIENIPQFFLQLYINFLIASPAFDLSFLLRCGSIIISVIGFIVEVRFYFKIYKKEAAKKGQKSREDFIKKNTDNINDSHQLIEKKLTNN